LSKVITSPVKRFSGTVVLSDPLTYPQVFAFQDALEGIKALGDDANYLRVQFAALPGILKCVEEWHLERVPEHPTEDTFPATPIRPAAELVSWLFAEISKLNEEADNVPLE
jgi:hypothetical protein